MNDESLNGLLIGISIMIPTILIILRWAMFTWLSFRMAQDSVSSDRIKKIVYLGQIILFIAFLFFGLFFSIAFSLPIYIGAPIALAGSLLILFNTKRVFKGVEKAAALVYKDDKNNNDKK